MDVALGDAQSQSTSGKRAGGGSQVSNLTSLLSQVPGAATLCQQAEYLQAQSDAQEHSSRGFESNFPRGPEFSAPPGSFGGPPGPGIPGMSPNFDPIKTAAQIYVSRCSQCINPRITGRGKKIAPARGHSQGSFLPV